MDENVLVFYLPENQVLDFLIPALLHRSPSRTPLRDREALFSLAFNFTRLADLWDALPRSDWMHWLVEQAGVWGLIPMAIATHIHQEFELVELVEMQADLMKKTLPNPFVFIDDEVLIERRRTVRYALMEGEGPKVGRLVALFR
jgi:hypothetical protein